MKPSISTSHRDSSVHGMTRPASASAEEAGESSLVLSLAKHSSHRKTFGILATALEE